MEKQAIFLDRDGTLCRENHYIYRWEDWEWLPGVTVALRGFQRLGFELIVVSNQSGVARGYYAEKDIQRLHAAVKRDLKRRGIRVRGFYFCPHHPDEGRRCSCRKPAPGLLLRAARKHRLDLGRSFMIGDKAIDVEAGRRAGAKPILVLTGYGRRERKSVGKKVVAVKDLLGALRVVRSSKL